MLIIPLTDTDATRALGARLAPLCTHGDVITLGGTLGAGKTTLIAGLTETLTGHAAISPTYTLVQTYGDDPVLWHFDFYRLDHPDMVWEAGLEDALKTGITLIEWPERANEHLPDDRLHIELENSGDGRIARLTAGPSWGERISHV